MKRLLAIAATLALGIPAVMGVALILPTAVQAQGNDNDYTPMGSRIRRERQFPTNPREQMARSRLSEVTRARGRDMVRQFGRCLWDRGNEKALDLLARTDFGFRAFEQIGSDYEEARDLYPIRTCLGRVVNSNSNRGGLRLSWDAESIRRWYIEAAYLDTWPDGPTWAVPGNAVAERIYPLSATYPTVHVAMDFADCVVAQDPVGVDYFYRTGEGTDEEMAALRVIVPAISPCVPQGQEMDIQPFAMRVWLGEALWHAANNNHPAAADSPQEDQ